MREIERLTVTEISPIEIYCILPPSHEQFSEYFSEYLRGTLGS